MDLIPGVVVSFLFLFVVVVFGPVSVDCWMDLFSTFLFSSFPKLNEMMRHGMAADDPAYDVTRKIKSLRNVKFRAPVVQELAVAQTKSRRSAI